MAHGSYGRVYSPFAYLLTAETEKKVVDFNNQTKTLSEVTAEIDKYQKVCQARAPALDYPAPRCSLVGGSSPRVDRPSSR